MTDIYVLFRGSFKDQEREDRFKIRWLSYFGD